MGQVAADPVAARWIGALSERDLRAAPAAFGVQLAVALWAGPAPRAFHREIADYGPFNAHYVADYTAFSGAIGLAPLASAMHTTWPAGILATSGLWFPLHAVNHALDVTSAPSLAIGIATFIALTLRAAAAEFLTVIVGRGWGSAP